MKTFTRLIIGFLSSLFAVAGLMRVAERLDPLSQSIAGTYSVSTHDDRPGDNCTLPCMYAPDADSVRSA
jgi:hypothetical protein